ncbi:MAG: 50S ribosomal protein L4 [Kiritimatiellae bacterium]|nr:50S ribosomal protein L4 [Kiritimatiellia bacterium]
MSKTPILDLQGGRIGEYDFPDELLVLNRGGQAVHEVIVAHRAGLRAGTASTLNKGLVAGSNRKPWRQKGLGRARAGYRQSPVWRGGGVVFGPKPRSYAKTVPKGVAALAFSRVVSEKVAGGGVKVLNDLKLTEGKSREIAALLKQLDVKGRVLIVVAKLDENLKRAARNIGRVVLSPAGDVSTYQLMLCPTMLITRDAADILLNRLRKITGKEGQS